ncbi:MAG: DinB family protein [Gemmatimonadetes bacterium]|nr:DinB family protein [Gemmatimonadota bacterium]
MGGFRFRMVLAHDRPAVPGYDQDRWAERLRYQDNDPATSIADFTALRRMNLVLLERATPADLARVAIHAERGEESLAHMLRMYAGHDLVHRRQIKRVLGG